MIFRPPIEAVSIASNIRDGKNPEYAIADFRKVMPGFTEDIISDEQLQHFIDMAQAVVKEARWHSLWREGMRLYIAHFVTLYLATPQDNPTRDALVGAGQAKGAATSKSVGGVSVSYDTGQISSATADLTGWGAFKLTTYGTQFATLAKMVVKGGMYVV